MYEAVELGVLYHMGSLHHHANAELKFSESELIHVVSQPNKSLIAVISFSILSWSEQEGFSRRSFNH